MLTWAAELFGAPAEAWPEEPPSRVAPRDRRTGVTGREGTERDKQRRSRRCALFCRRSWRSVVRSRESPTTYRLGHWRGCSAPSSFRSGLAVARRSRGLGHLEAALERAHETRDIEVSIGKAVKEGLLEPASGEDLAKEALPRPGT